MAHHGVNVNVVYHALLVTPMESRPTGGQEGMHAWESIVIAMVTYWRNAKLRVNISISVCMRRILLPLSSPPPKGIYFNQRQMQNIKAAVGSNTEGTQSLCPLPQSPEVFSHTGVQPLLPPAPSLYLFSFQSSTFSFLLPTPHATVEKDIATPPQVSSWNANLYFSKFVQIFPPCKGDSCITSQKPSTFP